MNIKSILPTIPALDARIKTDQPKEMVLEESRDRDPNGRQERGEEHPHRQMTDEELAKALEIIKGLPGLSASSLRVRLVKSENFSIVLLEGPNGETIRRLTEADLWQVLANQEKKTGQILDKAM